MISYVQKNKRARELRLSGKSYSEISKELIVSRGALSNWLKDIVLSGEQVLELKNRVSSKMNRGRLNASIMRRSGRIFREKKIFDEAEKEFKTLAKDPFFMTGLSLYWAKGLKRGYCLEFTSHDKAMVQMMLIWIKKYLNLDDSLIKQRNFTRYSRITVTRIDPLRRVIAWQKLLIKYYDIILSV